MLKRYLKIVVYLAIASWFSVANAGAYEDYFKAVEMNDARGLQALLQRGFDPNTRDEQGQHGLYLALRGEAHAAADTLLVTPGVQVDATNAVGETPLMMAALRGNLDWTRKLLDKGAKVHQDGWSPVLYAAAGPDPRVVGLLLDRGAPVNARSPNGTTPLMMAARYGDERSVKLLLDRGADATLRNDRNLTAADFARDAGREELSRRLQGLVR